MISEAIIPNKEAKLMLRSNLTVNGQNIDVKYLKNTSFYIKYFFVPGTYGNMEWEYGHRGKWIRQDEKTFD